MSRVGQLALGTFPFCSCRKVLLLLNQGDNIFNLRSCDSRKCVGRRIGSDSAVISSTRLPPNSGRHLLGVIRYLRAKAWLNAPMCRPAERGLRFLRLWDLWFARIDGRKRSTGRSANLLAALVVFFLESLERSCQTCAFRLHRFSRGSLFVDFQRFFGPKPIAHLNCCRRLLAG
jgi:hypothetical protein